MPGWQALLLGVPVAALVAFMTEGLPITQPSRLFLQPARLFTFCFRYFPYFWWESFKANLDVAYRVLHPRLPIRPGIIRMKTEIKSDMGLTILANSVSLMPGTTTVDIDSKKGLIYVHCMTVSETDAGQRTRLVVQRFESMLRKVFE
jgi:multicomponent Na+:H+ antiporter subunit E